MLLLLAYFVNATPLYTFDCEYIVAPSNFHSTTPSTNYSNLLLSFVLLIMIDIGFHFVPLIKPVVEEDALIGILI